MNDTATAASECACRQRLREARRRHYMCMRESAHDAARAVAMQHVAEIGKARVRALRAANVPVTHTDVECVRQHIVMAREARARAQHSAAAMATALGALVACEAAVRSAGHAHAPDARGHSLSQTRSVKRKAHARLPAPRRRQPLRRPYPPALSDDVDSDVDDATWESEVLAACCDESASGAPCACARDPQAASKRARVAV